MKKRLFDIALSITLLIILLPVFVTLSLIIKLTSVGPAFYRQKRIGFGGQLFNIYKFRTMYLNNSSVCITLTRDPRITPVGKILRKMKIDELPQLWNILKGEMSFVGPRPDVTGYSDHLTGSDRIIWTVRPGLTGADSLVYRNEAIILDNQPNPQQYYNTTLWPDKVRINIQYIQNQSFWLDLLIIVATIVPIQNICKMISFKLPDMGLMKDYGLQTERTQDMKVNIEMV
jgi:lipopolysaccharide/colanic/teichoic acid biosynthesis glycosyltransferase